MADLPEDDTFPDAITQIETTDPVSGGPAGIANRALIQLAKRTRWLRNRLDIITMRPRIDDPSLGTVDNDPSGAAVRNLWERVMVLEAGGAPAPVGNGETRAVDYYRLRTRSSSSSGTGQDVITTTQVYTSVDISGYADGYQVRHWIDGVEFIGAYTISAGWYQSETLFPLTPN